MENCQKQDRVMQDAFDLYGDRIAVVHAKDFIIRDETFTAVCTGRGCLNYGLLLDLIQKRKPYVSILLEEASEDTVEECTRYIHSIARGEC